MKLSSRSRIYVAGHRGLVGSAIVRRLSAAGFDNLVTSTHAETDLSQREAVERFFEKEKPQVVFLAAARVGGILANRDEPADFIRDNLLIQSNVIDASYRHGVEKLVFLGSSCIYPRMAPQPISEEALLTGPLEPTNEPYAIAKIAGLLMCRSYRRQYGFSAISLMPTNLYGPNDNFDLARSHVLAALVRKFHEAREAGLPDVEVWGTGAPRREFLHSDDLADAALFLLEKYDDERPINVGTGSDVSIAELSELVRARVNPKAAVRFDNSKPDGVPRKLLDVSRLHALGWHHKIDLPEGIQMFYESYLEASPRPLATPLRNAERGRG